MLVAPLTDGEETGVRRHNMEWFWVITITYGCVAIIGGIYYFAFVSSDCYREEEEAGRVPMDPVFTQVMIFLVVPILFGILWLPLLIVLMQEKRERGG